MTKPKIDTGISRLTEQAINKTKLVELVPILSLIAHEWKLDINRKSGFDASKRILINSVKYN